jgi:hypothetical protein
MKRRSSVTSLLGLVLVSALFVPGEAWPQEQAQTVSPITVGSRVRVLAPSAVKGQVEGTVMQIDENSLLLSTDDHLPLTVPRGAIARLDVSTGRHRKWLKGMCIGAVIGAVSWGASYTDCTSSSCDTSRGDVMAIGAVGGSIWGAGIGALFSGDRWSPVPLERVRVSLGPTRRQGMALSLSVGW